MTITLATMTMLRRFVSRQQLHVLQHGMAGEEKDWFRDKARDLACIFDSMPRTYQQDGLGMNAVAHLHYFTGGCDWWITERDQEPEQHQAFGLADIGFGGELGYISIVELIRNNVELDFHWTPRTLTSLNRRAAA